MFEGLSANHTFLTIVITFLYDKTLESCVSESTEADSLNVTWNIYLLQAKAPLSIVSTVSGKMTLLDFCKGRNSYRLYTLLLAFLLYRAEGSERMHTYPHLLRK